MAEPENPPIVHQNLDGGPTPISEDKDGAGEWVGGQLGTAQLSDAIYAFPEISGVDRHENPHLRRDLDHPCAPQNAAIIAGLSMAVADRMIIRRPRSSVSSTE